MWRGFINWKCESFLFVGMSDGIFSHESYKKKPHESSLYVSEEGSRSKLALRQTLLKHVNKSPLLQFHVLLHLRVCRLLSARTQLYYVQRPAAPVCVFALLTVPSSQSNLFTTPRAEKPSDQSETQTRSSSQSPHELTRKYATAGCSSQKRCTLNLTLMRHQSMSLNCKYRMLKTG